jgi:hypothetical protein
MNSRDLQRFMDVSVINTLQTHHRQNSRATVRQVPPMQLRDDGMPVHVCSRAGLETNRSNECCHRFGKCADAPMKSRSSHNLRIRVASDALLRGRRRLYASIPRSS